jgi:hypothetical protein
LSTVTLPRYPAGSRSLSGGHWQQRLFSSGDVGGAIALLIPAMLFVFSLTTIHTVEVGMYVVGLIALLPCLPPFVSSLHRNATSVAFVMLFLVLSLSTAAAFYETPSADVWLRAKGLGATAVWASIYVIALVAARSADAANRFVRWVDAICVVISASVVASAGLHVAGISFGEIIVQADGTFRAFGPLGDQVAFVVLLPALTSLMARRPLMFGFHAAAMVLTGTRGALLCLAIGIAGYLVVGGRRRMKQHLWQIVAVTLVAGVVALTPVSAALRQRFLDPSMRADAAQASIAVIARSPIIGFGFNGLDTNRSAVAEDWLMPEQAANGLSRSANQYLQTAVDGGLPACLLLILFAGLAIRNAYRVLRWSGATPQLMASQLWLIAILLGNQSSPWLLSDTPTGFFTFAIAGVGAAVAELSVRRHSPVRLEQSHRLRP